MLLFLLFLQSLCSTQLLATPPSILEAIALAQEKSQRTIEAMSEDKTLCAQLPQKDLQKALNQPGGSLLVTQAMLTHKKTVEKAIEQNICVPEDLDAVYDQFCRQYCSVSADAVCSQNCLQICATDQYLAISNIKECIERSRPKKVGKGGAKARLTNITNTASHKATAALKGVKKPVGRLGRNAARKLQKNNKGLQSELLRQRNALSR